MAIQISSKNMINTSKIREQTLAFFEQEGIAIDYHLPLLAVPSQIRSKEEIANRINILHLLYAIYLNGAKSRSFYYGLIKKEKLTIHLSTTERKSLSRILGLNRQDVIDFSWKKESTLALLWVCQVTESKLIHHYEQEGDLSHYYSKIPPDVTVDAFIRNIKPLELENILKGVDLYYILHSLVLHDKLALPSQNADRLRSLIIERRRALEWVIDTENNWDEISLDT